MDEIDMKIIQKLLLARVYKYAILKKINKTIKTNSKKDIIVEFFEKKEWNFYEYEFFKNFKNYIGVSGNNDIIIEKYKDEIAKYMEDTFPYSLGIHFESDDFNRQSNEQKLETTLKFFILSQYANKLDEFDEYENVSEDLIKKEVPVILHLESIIPEILNGLLDLKMIELNMCSDVQANIDILKNIKMKNGENGGQTKILNTYTKQSVDTNLICGSMVEKYKCLSLYDVLLQINDKRINRYIEYIMINGGIENCKSSIFDDVVLSQDQSGKMYVAEGNHRIFTYKALKSLKSFIEHKKIEGIDIGVNIQYIVQETEINKTENDTSFEYDR